MMLSDHPQPGTITTSDEVSHTYYGQPVIHGPHWRWLIINYFFLAALAGGGATIATLADLFSPDRNLTRLGRYLSLAAIIPAPVLLTLDLGRPERAFHMFRIVKLKSPMSLGSWALLTLGMLSTVSGGLQALADLTGRDLAPGWRRVVGVITLPFSVFVMGYTGVLLAATNVPLWARNYLLLGPTFMASAFSGTLSALSLALHLTGRDQRRTEQALARAESICLAAELILLLAGVRRLGRLGHPLTRGAYGLIFWPFTLVAGIVAPLVLLLRGPVRGSSATSRQRVVTSLLVLAGGYSLRALMILAGRKSASRPQDYFEYTGTRMD